MDFTIGVITDGNHDGRLNTIIQSVRAQQIPNYEIIIVGNSKLVGHDLMVVPFNESLKPKWITKKKNRITENAKYENVVYLHDYIKLDPEWYRGFLQFGNDFSICMTKMKTPSGQRFRDWTIDAMASISHIVGNRKYERLLPYKDLGLSKIMYISGAYWVAKREVMEKFPLDERLCWGESEDIEWSHRVRKHLEFSINPHSTARLLVEKSPSFTEMKDDLLNRFINISEEELQIIIDHGDKYYRETHG